MKPYAQYKESGVDAIGRIPEHWVVQPVRNLARIVNGYPFDSELFSSETGIPLVRIRDLDQTETDTLYAGALVQSAIVTKNDILIGMDGDFNLGRWLGNGNALLNQRLCCVRSDSPLIARLLEYSLPNPLKRINEVTYSTTVKHLSSRQVEKIKIAIPADLQEQLAIATYLDRETAKIDTLISKQEQLIALLEEKRQALISHAVTKGLDPNVKIKDTSTVLSAGSGVEWLGKIPEHWEVIRLKYLCTKIGTGNTPSDKSDFEGEVPWYTPGDFESLELQDSVRTVKADYFLREGKTIYPANSLYIVSIGATLGKIAISNVPASANQQINICIIRQALADPRFLLHYLGAHTFLMRSTASSATLDIMNQEKTGSVLIVMPTPTEQHAIVAHLDKETAKFEALKAKANQVIELLKEKRSALISAAVTGKIDVRGQVPTEVGAEQPAVSGVEP